MTDVTIRPARHDDAEAMLDIYRPCVQHTTISFETEVPDADAFRTRIDKAQSRWTWLVAQIDGCCAGYAYASMYRERAAYRYSCETSAYVAPGFHRRGVGTRLYAALFERLAALGYCNAYAGIALPNEASVALHRAVGFAPVGVFERAGWKFDGWHDVSWWQRRLRDAPPS